MCIERKYVRYMSNRGSVKQLGPIIITLHMLFLYQAKIMPMIRDCLLSYSYHKINKLFEYFNYLDNKIRDISHSLVKRAMFWEGVMKKSKNVKSIVSVVLTASLILSLGAIGVQADVRTESISGNVYIFDEKNPYDIEGEGVTRPAISSSNVLGKLSISGEMNKTSPQKGFDAFIVDSGNVSISYSFDEKKLDADESDWHIVSDGGKEINNIPLKSKIESGAIIVETSLDGEKWTGPDVEKTNVFTKDSSLNDDSFYTTKDIQLVNGCYYRITVVHREERKIGDKTLAGVDVGDDIEVRKYAEIYQFYAAYVPEKNPVSPSDTPMKKLGDVVNTGHDTGFSGNDALDKNDPHYGWTLGEFFVNGYTRDTKDANGDFIFLKNVGDKVTLWFNLKQDINKLNNDANLSISDDTKAYDKYFQIPETSFKHGALIIQFTDHNNQKHDPIIYTDFLEANTRTGADTRVQLFEEGDYEVHLDYEIAKKNGPVYTYTDYSISFKFKIRNGNCMVFPFDLAKGNELSDGAITSNGFKLDMAKSRYLDIDVKYSALKENADGTYTADVRFNRPAQDGDEYSKEGIYEFAVKNLYTGETTTKTIYVGSGGVLKALSSTGMTLDELNAKIREGATISEDGSIVIELPDETVATSATVETEETVETSATVATTTSEQTISPEVSEERAANETSETEAVIIDDVQPSEKEKGNGVVVVLIIIVVLVAVGAGGYFYSAKMRKPKSNSHDDTISEGDLPAEEIPAVETPIDVDNRVETEESSAVNESPEAEEAPMAEETTKVEVPAEMNETVKDAEDINEGGDKL